MILLSEAMFLVLCEFIGKQNTIRRIVIAEQVVQLMLGAGPTSQASVSGLFSVRPISGSSRQLKSFSRSEDPSFDCHEGRALSSSHCG